MDPALVCKAFLKGKCPHTRATCKKIHNPPCYFLRKHRKRLKGDDCLFPHRDASGAMIAREEAPRDGSEAGAAAAVQPTDKKKPKPKIKAKAKAKAGKGAAAAIVAEGPP